MTPQEAINIIEDVTWQDNGRHYGKIVPAREIAISALERQISKKPIKKNSICYAKTKDGQEYFAFDYFCPNCSEKIKLSEHHCKCGQALDWSDTE